MKINRKINCKNQKELQKQSIKTLLIKSIKTYKININRNIDKFIDQNQYPMLRAGIWSFNPQWSQGRKLREIVQLTTGLKGSHNVSYEHVKSHSNQPCNELVDILAKEALKKLQYGLKEAPTWDPLFRPDNNALSWAWWYARVAQQDPAHPRLTHGQHVWSMPTRRNVSTGRINDLVYPLSDIAVNVDGALTVATFNVMTLAEHNGDGVESGEHWRAALLREQLECRKIHAIGLQETRARSNITLQTANYLRVISGNLDRNGHHGCELWLSKVTPIGWQDEEPILFDLASTTVLLATSRILAVHTKPRGISFVFIVCHLPHEGTDEAIKDSWWEQLREIIRKHEKLGFCFLLGDFNARLDRSNPPHVGEKHNGDSSDNEDRLQLLLEDFSMWLPSTFLDIHQGSDWTWTHARGTHARIDYVVAPLRDDVCVVNSYVDYDMQIPIQHRDHEMVCMEVICSISRCKTKRQPRRNYDWERMATEEGKEKLRMALQNAPKVGWEEDVHHHWERLENYIHDQLQQHFPIPKKPKRHSIFSSTTWQALDLRKNVKRQLCGWDDEWHELMSKWALRSWRLNICLREGFSFVKFQAYLLLLIQRSLLHGFREAARCLKKSVKEDKSNFVDQIATQAQQTRGVDLFAELKRNSGKGAPPHSRALGEQLIHNNQTKYGPPTAPRWKQRFGPLHPNYYRDVEQRGLQG